MILDTKIPLGAVFFVAASVFVIGMMVGKLNPAEETPVPPSLSLESLAAALDREVLQESNNWRNAVVFLQQVDARLKALEPQPAPVPVIQPPLTSAPSIVPQGVGP